MNRISRIVCLSGTCVVLFCTGCSKSAPTEQESPAVVTVDGHVLRLAEVEAKAQSMMSVHRHRYPNASQKALEGIRTGFALGYPKHWVENRVLADYAAAEKLSVSPDLFAEYRTRALNGLKAKSDRSPDAVLKAPGVRVEYIEEQIRAEALRQVIAEHLVSLNPTNITDAYVEEQLENIRDYNARMTVENAAIYARATNVWNRLKAGDDFVKLVHEATEVEDEKADDGQWGVFDLSAFDQDPALQTALKALKPGEFTPPVEGDNGLMIARLNEVDDTGGMDISRIIFRLPLFYTPAPREAILAAGYDKYRKALFDRKLRELLKNAVIDYANKKNEEKK